MKGEVTNSVSVRSDLFDSNPADDWSDLVVQIGLHRFNTLTPCRLVDTRESGPALAAGSDRTFTLLGLCGIPSPARALAERDGDGGFGVRGPGSPMIRARAGAAGASC